MNDPGFKWHFTRDKEPIHFESYQYCAECGQRLPVDELIEGMCPDCHKTWLKEMEETPLETSKIILRMMIDQL